ncbi:hypothetical protein LEMLEM_LOCUS2625, partial [Lemmus lemmus]
SCAPEEGTPCWRILQRLYVLWSVVIPRRTLGSSSSVSACTPPRPTVMITD